MRFYALRPEESACINAAWPALFASSPDRKRPGKFSPEIEEAWLRVLRVIRAMVTRVANSLTATERLDVDQQAALQLLALIHGPDSESLREVHEPAAYVSVLISQAIHQGFDQADGDTKTSLLGPLATEIATPPKNPNHPKILATIIAATLDLNARDRVALERWLAKKEKKAQDRASGAPSTEPRSTPAERKAFSSALKKLRKTGRRFEDLDF